MRNDAARRLVAAGREPQARDRLLGALAKIARRGMQADRADITLRDTLLAEHGTSRESIDWGRQQPEAAIRA